MDPADKDLLISRRPDLVENIDITNGLLTHLLSRKVLNQRMVQAITYNKPPDRQVEELLDLLPKRGPNAFKLFCESLLATDQEDVVTSILQKSADVETWSASSSSSTTANSVPASPSPSLVTETYKCEVPVSIATPLPESLPVLQGSVLGLAVSASQDLSLHVPSLQASPPPSPHKRKPVRLSREGLENDDKSVLACPSETDSSPFKRLRPDSSSVICIRGNNENVIKIYQPAPDEKGDHQEKGVSKSGVICQESAPFPSRVVADTSLCSPASFRGEEVRHVLKHFVLRESEEDRSQEAHRRLASSMLADLPQDYLNLVTGKHNSPSKMRTVDDFSSEIMRERLSRSDSLDTMETRKPQNLKLNVGMKALEADQPDQSVGGVERVASALPPMTGLKPSEGPVHVHVEECTRQFYNQNKEKSYRMIGMPRGQALIINVNEVLEKPPRRGTDIDRDNLKNLLEQLHFEVTIYNDDDDLTALGMAEKLRAFARKPEHSTADACMICLLSHGEEGYMFGTDGKKIPLDEVFLLFDNRHCPALLNKPKIFFIQACRGGMLDQGVKVKLDEPDGGSPGHNNNIRQHPSMSDMLICYPTLQGYYAWRNREKGSWYIEAVVKVFMKYAKCEDVCAMLNRVNSDVSSKVSRTPQMEMDRMSQMSEYKSSLRKPYLFFFPGIGAPAV